MVFDVFQYSNKGGRSYNEDASGWITDNDVGIFVVADGLGGHALGDLASDTAVTMLVENIWIDKAEDVSEQLSNKIGEANRAILKLQEQDSMGQKMKTTVAALAVYGDNAVWANVGDSRVYFIHNNKLHSYTDDHSVAYKKYKAGEITREQLSTDEDQSRLLRALGNPERCEPSLYSADVLLKAGDAFFLCSDGAWELLKDEEIVIDYLKAEDARQWAELLLVRMMERVGEGHDNLTLMTVILQ